MTPATQHKPIRGDYHAPTLLLHPSHLPPPILFSATCLPLPACPLLLHERMLSATCTSPPPPPFECEPWGPFSRHARDMFLQSPARCPPHGVGRASSLFPALLGLVDHPLLAPTQGCPCLQPSAPLGSLLFPAALAPMNFPSSEADSPTNFRGIAGPSRARLQARQHRNSALKPYDRPSAGQVAGGARVRTDSALSVKSGIQGDEAKGASSGGGGLLSGLRQAIFSRPLSWLQGSAAKSQTASSLPTHGQQSAAQRLTTSLNSSKGSGSGFDIESHTDGMAGRAKMVAPPSVMPNRSHPVAYSPARSPSPARSSASAAIQSHGLQRLSGVPASHLGTPGYRRGGSLRPEGSGNMTASQSSPSYAFGFGSEKRLAGISSVTGGTSPFASSSLNPLPSRSPFSMSRHSVAGSSAGGSVLGLDRSSHRFLGPGQLTTPSRSRPASLFGEVNRSRAGSVADSRMSTSSQTPKRREWSSLKLAPPKMDLSEGEELMQSYMAMRDGALGSRQGFAHPALHHEVGPDMPMMEFGAGALPFQRAGVVDDGSLKRGASMSVDGDETMSEIAPRKRQKMVWDAELGFVSKMDVRARQGPRPAAKNEAERLLNALEGMRTPETRGESSRSSPVSLLRGTDGHSAHLNVQQSLRQSMTVSVPLSVSERSDVERGPQRLADELSKTVSPHSRTLKHRKRLVEPEDERGMRARLRKPGRQVPVEPNAKGKDRDGSDDSMGAPVCDKDESSADESGEEAIVEPPRRRGGASVRGDDLKTLRSGKVLPPASPTKESGTTAPSTAPAPMLHVGKVVGKEPPQSKPLSKARLEISVGGASSANRQRAGQSKPAVSESKTAPLTQTKVPGGNGNGNFTVLGSDVVPLERARSSLRQGAEKTHRSHAKSGRVGLDDDEDDEGDDSPSTDELSKIKLPTNLFPQGFIFSGSTSPAVRSDSATPSSDERASAAAPVLKEVLTPSDDVSSSQKDAGKGTTGDGVADNSLLGRLGGFASDAPAKKASPSSFSFSVPPKASEPAIPTSKPLFNFQPISSTSSAQNSDSFKAPNTLSGSDFFQAPKPSSSSDSFMPASLAATERPSSTPPASRNDGPVPDFFASSLAKASSSQGSETASASKPLFSLGASADVGASKPSPSPFSFSSPASTTDSTRASTFTPAPADKSVSTNAPSFSVAFGETKGEDGSKNKVAFPDFGASKATGERSATKETNPPPVGGFGVPAFKPADGASKAVSPSTPSPFSFGPPASATPALSFNTFSGDASKKRVAEEQEEPTAKRANGFPSSTSFAFGSNSFGGAKAGDEAATPSKPAFEFGTPAKTAGTNTGEPSKPFSFGTPAGGNTSFGGSGKSEMMDTSPSSAPNGSTEPVSFSSPATSSKPGFSFGSTASSAPGQSTQGGFSFGSSALPAKPSAPAISNTPSFTFGAASGTSGTSGSGGMFAQPLASSTKSNPFGTAPSTGGFGSSNTTADSSRQGSPAAFTFGGSGSATSQPMGGFASGFGSGGTQPSFAFGAPSGASVGAGAAVSTATSTSGPANGGFSFSMPASDKGNASGGTGNTNAFLGAANPGASSPAPAAPFVFGSAAGGSSTPPPSQTPAPSSGFAFGMGSPAPQSPGGANLFNIGAPPPAGAGNRPVRGMPSRRKR